MEVKHFPPYISATPKLIADLDYFDLEKIFASCGEQVPWTDFFSILISQRSEFRIEAFATLFAKKAKEVGEELIDAFIDGKFEYLERFRVSNNEDSKKYVKSNILFEFPNEKHKENSMKLAAQQYRVTNLFAGETIDPLIFPCIALVTKCGLRVVASSLLPLNKKETLKYGIQDGILKRENQTVNSCFKLIAQMLNLKQHSIANVKGDGELLCAEVQGHFGTDRNYYLSNLTRLLPLEAPFNSEKPQQDQFKMFFLNVDLVRTSSTPLNNDCFTPFWNGNEDQRKEEEGNIRKVTDLIYSTLIPELSRAIQNGKVKVSYSDKIKENLHKRMLSLHHLPYLIENILSASSKLSSECEKSLDILLIELFSRVLKWKWYSLMNEATNKEEKQKQTLALKNEFFSNENSKSIWNELLRKYCQVRAIGLKQPSQFIQELIHFISPQFLEKIQTRFSELCGISIISSLNSVTFRCILKRMSKAKPKTLEELIEFKKESELRFGKNSLPYAISVIELAKQNQKQGATQTEINETIQGFKEALSIFETLGFRNEWLAVAIHLQILTLSQDVSTLPLDLKTLKLNLERIFGREHPSFAKLINFIGIILYDEGKKEEAFKFFEECLETQQQQLKIYGRLRTSFEYLTSLMDIILILKQYGYHEEALKYLDISLKTKEKLFAGEKQHPTFATSFISIGSSLKRRNRFDEALKYYENAMKIQEQTIGKNHPEYATTINNIGAIFDFQGKLDEALKYYKESLEIQRKTNGTQNQDYATTLNNIALLLDSQCQWEEALKYLFECLKIREKTIGKQHVEYSVTLTNIGLLLMGLSRYEDSLKHLNECLKLREQMFGKQNPQYAKTLDHIASALKCQGKFDEALKCLKDCLKIQEKTIGKQHPDYASTLGNIGSIYKVQGYLDDALKYLREALKIQVLTKDLGYSTILFHTSEVLEEKGQFDESLKMARECLEIDSKIFPHSDAGYALDLMRLGSVLGKKGEFQESMEILREAQSIMETSYKTQEHPDVARVLFALGQTYRLAGNETEAMRHFQKSLSIREKKLGKHHLLTLRTQSEMEGKGTTSGEVGLKKIWRKTSDEMPMFIQLVVDRSFELLL